MIRTDEEIDKLFKDAASKVEVSYQDSYWSEMEALLPKNSNKKPFWWFFGVILALMGFASTLFVFLPHKSQIAKHEQKNSGISQTISSNQSTKENWDKIESNNSKIKSKNQSQNQNSVNDVERKLNSTSTEFNELHFVEKGNKQMAEHLEEQVDVQMKPIKETIGTKNADLIVRKKTSTNVNEKESPNSSSENQIRTNKPLDKSDLIEKSMKNEEELAIVEKSSEAVVQEFTKQLKEEKSDQQVQKFEKDSLNKSKDTLSEDDLSTESTDNQVNEITSSLKVDKDLKHPVNSSSYYIQAGASFGQSYLKTPTNNLMAGITLGIGYQHVKPGIGYSIGLHVTSSFVKNMEIVRKSRVYGFGVTNYQQNLKYKQLTYLEVPISINYTHQKNTFFVGLNPRYLVSTRMNFSEFQELEVINERNYYGQKLGLRSVGLEAMIGYQRILKDNWSVGVNLGMALIQQIEPNHFEYQAIDFPIKGQITLRRTLIFKK